MSRQRFAEQQPECRRHSGAESETYDIYINGDNTVEIEYTASNGQVYTQTPSGPVDTITADTGSGNDIIRIHNLAPNTVKVNFTGVGNSVLYNPNATTGPNGQKVNYAKDANGNFVMDANGNPEIPGQQRQLVPPVPRRALAAGRRQRLFHLRRRIRDPQRRRRQ